MSKAYQTLRTSLSSFIHLQRSINLLVFSRNTRRQTTKALTTAHEHSIYCPLIWSRFCPLSGTFRAKETTSIFRYLTILIIRDNPHAFALRNLRECSYAFLYLPQSPLSSPLPPLTPPRPPPLPPTNHSAPHPSPTRQHTPPTCQA